MPIENRFLLDKPPFVLKQGDTETLRFSPADFAGPEAAHCAYRLRLRGDVCIDPTLLWEGGIPNFYREIDDALCTDTHHSRFSLRLSASEADSEVPKRAYYKLVCPLRVSPQYAMPESSDTVWRFTCLCKTDGLTPHNTEACGQGKQRNARAEIAFQRFLKQPNRDMRDIAGEPFETVRIPIPTASTGGKWETLSGSLTIDDATAAVLVTIAFENVVGNVLLEEPVLQNSLGHSVLPIFDLSNPYHTSLNWLGENLSRKEWTDLQLTVNGMQLAPQRVFQRCFRGSENELLLPTEHIKAGENNITIKNTSDYLLSVPYCVTQCEVLWEPLFPVRILAVPRTVVQNKTFAVLLKTAVPDTSVEITASEGLIAPALLHCACAGLHVLTVQAQCGSTGAPLSLTVGANGHVEHVKIERIVVRGEDGVLTGTGDAVYIPQEIDEMERFFAWYCANALGNLITFRPVYRWTGSKTLRPATWRRMAQLCTEMQLYYCHMIDGRELPGINANPTNALLAGPYYLGNQAHEQDGAYDYWRPGAQSYNEMFTKEISRRVFEHPDCLYRTQVVYENDAVFRRYSQTAPRDMAQAAAQFVRLARLGLSGVKRHTGPSTLFRYLYQAGIEVCGAELGYGPHEILLAALRGAARAYGQNIITAHIAVQWGTTPHDTPARYRRYQLALFVCYMNGAHHINTEEGLYRMEEFFSVLDRFSSACQEHASIQCRFAQFCATHTRRGVPVRDIAVLHGANDGWSLFTRGTTWGQTGEAWQFDTPEESWDLLRVFYPDSVLDAIYRHPCPEAPQGYFSRTPYGQVDILPVEADSKILQEYNALAFLGWNTANAAQLVGLTEYVKGGGTLLLGWPHLFVDVDRACAIHGAPHPLEAHALTGVLLRGFLAPEGDALPFDAFPGCKKTLPTLGDITLSAETEVLERVNGVPLVTRHSLGKGQVLFVNAREYPAAPAVRAVYERLLRTLGEAAVARRAARGVLTSADTVETSLYDREDGHRVLYAVNTNWWSIDDESACAQALLTVGQQSFPVRIPRGALHIFTLRATLCGAVCAATADADTEVLAIVPLTSGFALHLQAGGTAVVDIYTHAALTCPDGTLCKTDFGYTLTLSLCGTAKLEFSAQAC